MCVINVYVCEYSDGKHENNLLKLAVDAARVRATVGEISDALEKVWVSHSVHSSPHSSW